MEKYEMVSLKGLKFSNGKGVNCELTGYYGLFIVNKGFIHFKDNENREIVKTPYANTKKVLQEIIDAGGLTSFSNVEFLLPVN